MSSRYNEWHKQIFTIWVIFDNILCVNWWVCVCVCICAFDDIYLRLYIMISIGSQDIFTIWLIRIVCLIIVHSLTLSHRILLFRRRKELCLLNADLPILDSNKSLFFSLFFRWYVKDLADILYGIIRSIFWWHLLFSFKNILIRKIFRKFHKTAWLKCYERRKKKPNRLTRHGISNTHKHYKSDKCFQ